MKVYRFFEYLSLLMVSFTGIIFAGGSDLFLSAGANSLGLDGLYLAGPNGIQSTITNPAGLIYLQGHGAELFLIDRSGQQEFDSQTQGMFRSFREDDFNYGGGIYSRVSGNLILAIAYNPVLGYNVNWPFVLLRTNASVTSELPFDMFHKITINSITPSASLNFGNTALGLSANIYRINESLSFPITNERWKTGTGAASYQLNYDQKGWAYGFSIGAVTSLSDLIRLGISIRSVYKSTLKGTAESQLFSAIDSVSNNSSVSSDFKMPWTFGTGIIYTISQNWKLNIDALYSLWSMLLDNLNISFDNQVWQNRLSKADSITGIIGNNLSLNLKNTIDLGLGIEYNPDQGFIYRAGYRYSMSPNSNEAFSMFFPVVNQHIFSAGFGYREENLSIDAAIVYLLGISNSVFKPNQPFASGKYNSNAFVPSVTVRYNF
jgi:opacity protein-like surface antigen